MAKFQPKVLARKLVIFINFSYLVLGILIIVAGVNFKSHAGQTTLIKDGMSLESMSDVVLFSGISTLTISILGFVSGYMEWKKVLVFYALSMFVTSIVLMALGSNLNNKTGVEFKPEWYTNTKLAKEAREELMNLGGIYGKCCGFLLNTDSYMMAPPCVVDLNLEPQTLSCSALAQKFLEIEIYPNARGAIWIGVAEFLSIIVSMVIIFTSKEMKQDFYDNPFHG